MTTVSVIVPTYNRRQLLIERALPSLSNQSYGNLEILVIGDGTDEETVEALRDYPDSRVSFTNLPHYDYPTDQRAHWGLQGLQARNYGLDHATGRYIAMLDDDDEMMPDAIDILLSTLKDRQVDFVYGYAVTYKDNQLINQRYGHWPPGDGALCNGAYVYRAALNYRFDLDCFAHSGLTGDADMWTRMYQNGVKFYYLAHHVLNYHRHYP